MFLLYIFFNMSSLIFCLDLDYNFVNLVDVTIPDDSNPLLNETAFCPLLNYNDGAQHVTVDQYPWIARVVHSTTEDYPHICTAICIEEMIFITAAVCAVGLKVKYTTIIYNHKRWNVKAMVLPSEISKQYHDDIAFIVVQRINNFLDDWRVIPVFSETRTDEKFQWFEVMSDSLKAVNFKVVGYAFDVTEINFYLPTIKYDLTSLDVIVDMNICKSILPFIKNRGFRIPCYSSCRLEEIRKKPPAENCNKYHGSEGSALINVDRNELLGVVTWGSSNVKGKKPYTPVGFAIPNSGKFYKDFSCARLIKNDNSDDEQGYFQSLCDQ